MNIGTPISFYDENPRSTTNTPKLLTTYLLPGTVYGKDLPKIFERYYKAKKMEDEPHKGSGLGLAIVKGILNLHHATIEVKSKENEFTQFSFRLPAYKV